MDSEKDYGPSVCGAMFGVCIASYIEHDVTRDEVLELAGQIYDAIKQTIAERHEDELVPIRRAVEKSVETQEKKNGQR